MTDRTPMQRALDAEAKVTDLAKRVEVLEAALWAALPYVESALDDESFKPGAVKKDVSEIRHALQMNKVPDALLAALDARKEK